MVGRILVIGCFLISSAAANVRLASIFGSHMVLQRDAVVPVWGTASPGERVTLLFAQQQVTATTDATGKWMVRLQPVSGTGPYEMTIAGEDTVRLKDVLVGEVWLCSGQSNMELAVERTTNAKEEIAAANYPMIRLFTVKRAVADSPQTSCSGAWALCDSVSVRKFSGAAYYFGRKLFKDLSVPIGLVHSSYGGSPAEAWMSPAALNADPDFVPILERWKRNVESYPERKREFDLKRPELMRKFSEDSAAAIAAGKAPPSRPGEPIGPGNRSTPSGLYNGMLMPLVPFAFKGVIWYQGESNVAHAHQYRKLFPALIQDWRQLWQTELPFYFVQLPNLDRQPDPAKSTWAELRESQMMTLRLPSTAMAVTIDVGDPQDLHPANKQDIGHRLALLAEGLLYGKNERTFQSPIYRAFTVEGSRMRITFSDSAGLHARGGGDLTGFVIAGNDHRFVPAHAKVEGNAVTVWSDAIAEPASVRYAWGDSPACNLVNDADLPASPFRTDDWPVTTTNKN